MDNMCTACLCTGRKMYFIGETGSYHLYSQILNEIPVYDFSAVCVRVCWECRAVLRRFGEFKTLVKRSYTELLQQWHQNIPPTKDHLIRVPHLQIEQVLNVSYPDDSWADTTVKVETDCDALPLEVEMKQEENEEETAKKLKKNSKKTTKEKGKKKNKVKTKLKKKKRIQKKSNAKKRRENSESVVSDDSDKLSINEQETDLDCDDVLIGNDDVEEKPEELVRQVEKTEKMIEEVVKEDLDIKAEEKRSKDTTKEKGKKKSKVKPKPKKKKRIQKTSNAKRREDSESVVSEDSDKLLINEQDSDIDCDDVLIDEDVVEEKTEELVRQVENTEKMIEEVVKEDLNIKAEEKKSKDTQKKQNGKVVDKVPEIIGDKPKCPECGKMFSSKKTFRYHLNTLHKGQNRYPCPRCGKIYQWKSNLGRHMRSHKARDSGELYCAACDKRFASVATYRQHLRVSRRHVSETDFGFTCAECGKKFVNKTRLRDHVDWDHLHKVKFSCSLCNKPFKCHTSLYVHMQNVHCNKKKENLCHICGKSYQNAAKLKYHIVAMHTSETPYRCGACHAAFGWYSSLYRHTREVHHKMKLQPKKMRKPKRSTEALSLLPLDRAALALGQGQGQG